jgi:hypothetical protein
VEWPEFHCILSEVGAYGDHIGYVAPLALE